MSPESQSNHNPRTITYDQIQSVDEVYAVFQSFFNSQAGWEVTIPGATFLQPGEMFHFPNKNISVNTFLVDPNHRRISSLKLEHPEDEKYLDLAKLLLRQGFTATETGLIPLFKSYLKNVDFEHALASAAVNSVKAVFQNYEKLVPAYYAFLVASNAGAAGINVAVLEGVRRYRINLESEGRERFEPFVGTRIDQDEEGTFTIQYERQCPASATAYHIAHLVTKCVEHIGKKPGDDGLLSVHTPLNNIEREIRDYLRLKMEEFGLWEN